MASLALVPSLLGACATTSGHSQARPLIGSQLYGWGQYYHRDRKNLDEHVDEVLGALRDSGYDYAETSLDVSRPEKNLEFADRLRARGLQPVSFYTGGRLHDEQAAGTVRKILEAARVARTAGFTVINCNPDPIGREKTDQELTTQVAALRELGRGLREAGMKLGIHHHTPEMRNGAREFHYNFQNSAVSEVGFCYDVHWVFRGGLKPAEVLPVYGDRVVSWHLRQSRGGVWWEDMDKGDIDYAAVARHSRRHGLAPLYTVELAIEDGTRITRSVVENHRRSLEFVRETFVG